jgi:hypothetical protein
MAAEMRLIPLLRLPLAACAVWLLTGLPAASEETPLPDKSAADAAGQSVEERQLPPEPLRGIYDRPFLSELWQRVVLGGYTEFEYHSFRDGVLEVPRGFRMHRTNLFLFTDLSERLRFGSEIEFETEFEGHEVSDEIEVAVEMAFVDWQIFEEFQVRGGAIVAPLGRVNVNHDGPIRELTERPLVSTFVLPTTLTEVGIGALGELEGPVEGLSFAYEVYAVNGFDLLDADGALAAEAVEKEKLLRQGRTALGGDVNDRPASLGRLSLEAARLLEAGFSWHTGTYDEKGDNLLHIVAGDLALTRDIAGCRLGVEGEIALAEFERDRFAETAGVPDAFWGFYVQGVVSGMPDRLVELFPAVFDAASRFTLVFRYDWVDLDGDRGEAFEPGINFRPGTDTVFKFSWKLTQRSLGLRDVPGRESWDDSGFVFSLASYF